jgi:hypothetical protein
MTTETQLQLEDSARDLLAAARTLGLAARRTDHGAALAPTLAWLEESLAVLAQASVGLADEMRRAYRLSDRPATACMEALDGLAEALDAARASCRLAHGKAVLVSGATPEIARA